MSFNAHSKIVEPVRLSPAAADRLTPGRVLRSPFDRPAASTGFNSDLKRLVRHWIHQKAADGAAVPPRSGPLDRRGAAEAVGPKRPTEDRHA
jgi:hypothetical protein